MEKFLNICRVWSRKHITFLLLVGLLATRHQELKTPSSCENIKGFLKDIPTSHKISEQKYFSASSKIASFPRSCGPSHKSTQTPNVGPINNVPSKNMTSFEWALEYQE